MLLSRYSKFTISPLFARASLYILNFKYNKSFPSSIIHNGSITWFSFSNRVVLRKVIVTETAKSFQILARSKCCELLFQQPISMDCSL